MKIKTKNLIGPALDGLVARCLGVTVTYVRHNGWYETLDARFAEPNDPHVFSPSTDWGQGGPIIEHESMKVQPFMHRNLWIAYIDKPYAHGDGPTPLIAAMRCYVASKLGDTVEIPEELA